MLDVRNKPPLFVVGAFATKPRLFVGLGSLYICRGLGPKPPLFVVVVRDPNTYYFCDGLSPKPPLFDQWFWPKPPLFLVVRLDQKQRCFCVWWFGTQTTAMFVVDLDPNYRYLCGGGVGPKPPLFLGGGGVGPKHEIVFVVLWDPNHHYFCNCLGT